MGAPQGRHRCLRLALLVTSLALFMALSLLDLSRLPAVAMRATSSRGPPPSSPISLGAYACSLSPEHPLLPPCSSASPEALEELVHSQYRRSHNLTQLSSAHSLSAFPERGWVPGPAWPGNASSLGCLALGHRHTVVIHARDRTGAPVHSHGSYLEAYLEGPLLRYRPRVLDHGNGTYTMEALLPSDPYLLGSLVTLRVLHLYSAWAGLTLDGASWFYQRPDDSLLLAHFALAAPGACGGLLPGQASAPPLPPPTASCSSQPFTAQPFWEGHWVRLPEAPGYLHGRGPALPACPPGLCTGDGSTLWSRWVYRLGTCHFHLFSPGDARRCLHGGHLWGSGDSNWMDSQRNLLAHVLALDIEGWLLPTDFVVHGKSNDMRGARPHPRQEAHPAVGQAESAWGAGGWAYANFSSSRERYGVWDVGGQQPLALPPRDAFNLTFRLGGIYNGGPNDADRNFGLSTVYMSGWRGRHAAKWAEYAGGQAPLAPPGTPDFPTALLLNSGLHDGLRFFGHGFVLKDYLAVSEDMLGFWEGLANASAAGGGGCAPRVLWKHTVTPAAGAREMKSNPQKMEFFNRLMAGRIAERRAAGAAADAAAAPPPLPQRHPRHYPQCKRPFHAPIGTDGRGPAWEFLDTFDMTFPFHYGPTFSDGGHYGRWACDGSPFRRCDSIDLMVLQVLLNALCSSEEVA